MQQRISSRAPTVGTGIHYQPPRGADTARQPRFQRPTLPAPAVGQGIHYQPSQRTPRVQQRTPNVTVDPIERGGQQLQEPPPYQGQGQRSFGADRRTPYSPSVGGERTFASNRRVPSYPPTGGNQPPTQGMYGGAQNYYNYMMNQGMPGPGYGYGPGGQQGFIGPVGSWDQTVGFQLGGGGSGNQMQGGYGYGPMGGQNGMMSGYGPGSSYLMNQGQPNYGYGPPQGYGNPYQGGYGSMDQGGMQGAQGFQDMVNRLFSGYNPQDFYSGMY